LKKGVQQVRVLYQGVSVDSEGHRRVTHNVEELLRPVLAGPSHPLQFAGPTAPPSYSPPKYKVTDPLATAEDFAAVIDDLRSDDFSRRVQAEMRLIEATPEGRHAELVAALEKVLGSDSNAVIRAQAAWVLEKWGAAENIPSLEKAARTDASPAVRSRATITIEAIKRRN
jgi:hypothetical protein